MGGPREDWSTSGYKIFVNADFTSGERMDVPGEMATRADLYCASLGHKVGKNISPYEYFFAFSICQVNHSFLPNCCQWFFDHPRFGVVPCHRTTREVRKGEELTLDYE